MAESATQSITMRLKIGENELEVTGPLAFVERKIGEFEARYGQGGPGTGAKAHEQRKQPRAQKQPASDTETEAADIMTIVNKLKERPDFGLIQECVLSKRDLWGKMRPILLHASDPMTSGEIANVLAGFGLKTGQPAVSKKLKEQSGSLLSTQRRRKGGPRPRYSLTSPAKSEAKKWLNETLK